MKLNKILLAASMALLSVGANAQDFFPEDVRIYINPGHGSWGGANNRHMPTIGHSPISDEDPDTTDFFESNTNLEKGLSMLYKLIDYGCPFDPELNQENDNPNRIGAALDLSQGVVMSRVKNGPYPFAWVNGVDPDSDNDFSRNLTEIAEEVETNMFDVFISIHSNAGNADAQNINYLAFLYRTNKGANGNDCLALCNTGWDQRIQDRHTQWTVYDNAVADGNVKISTGNYIVLAHSVPGYLVEGYFHTYQPARHRAMNFDVDRVEGHDYARGVADYFMWEKEETGNIYGIVRDDTNPLINELYTYNPKTPDKYAPLNDVDVTLKKDGEVVGTYKTDINYNGAFVFMNVEAGDYTVEFAHPDYQGAEPIEVTVEAAKTSYPTAFLKNTSGVEGIEADNNAPVEYYNLQGIKVANPQGGVFIKLQGEKASKEYIK